MIRPRFESRPTKIALLQHTKDAAFLDKLHRLGGYELTTADRADLIVGVSNLRFHNRTPIVHEIEFAYRLFAQRLQRMPTFIGVTGTNGKTTVTKLLASLLDCPAAGNIYDSQLLLQVPENDAQVAESPDHIVVEVASAQCGSIRDFHPHVAIITNIRADHLPFHGGVDDYARAKARIFLNQTEDDLLIYNAQDEKTSQIVDSCRARMIAFDVDAPQPYDIEKIKHHLQLPGRFNVENALACVIAARHLGTDEETIYRRLSRFHGVPHRMELVREVHGTPIYNNSSSTNPDSTINVLAALNGRGTLIMGGQYKDYLPIDELLASIQEHCSNVVLYGSSAGFFKERLGSVGYKRGIVVSGLRPAIEKSVKHCEDSDYILFSPSCLAYDMFKNTKERGNEFNKIVKQWL